MAAVGKHEDVGRWYVTQRIDDKIAHLVIEVFQIANDGQLMCRYIDNCRCWLWNVNYWVTAEKIVE